MSFLYKNFIQPFINLVFPNRCLFCGVFLNQKSCICDNCKGLLELIGQSYCKRCGAPQIEEIQTPDCSQCNDFNFSFRKNESLGVYTGVMRELIHQLKFKKRISLSSFFADLMIQYKKSYIMKHNLLVPVPLNRCRYSERGFNQSYLLCRSIARRINIDFNGEVLSRKGSSLPQSEMDSLQKRLLNLTDRFCVRSVKENLIKGKDILIIDDVITTGATVSACAEALYIKGARSVDVLTVARAVRER